MISRNFSSDRLSPPLASGWCSLTSSLNLVLISSFARLVLEIERAQRFALQRLQLAAVFGRRCGARRPVDARSTGCWRPNALGGFGGPAAIARAVRPGVGARFPGRPVTGDRILAEIIDLGVAHAVKVIVAVVVLAHMIDAEVVELRRHGHGPSARDADRACRSPSTGTAATGRASASRPSCRKRGCYRKVWNSVSWDQSMIVHALRHKAAAADNDASPGPLQMCPQGFNTSLPAFPCDWPNIQCLMKSRPNR